MKDGDKTTEQWAAEVTHLRQRIAELETAGTERKRAEEALKKSAQLLMDTGEMAKVGGWELDLSTKEVLLTEELYRIHGLEPGYNLKLEEALDFYAPESRPDVEAVVKKAAETGEPYDLESLFIPRGDKDKIWVRSLGRAVYSGGKIVKLTGTFQNIDKYKRAEEALKAERQRLHDVLESMPIMVCLLTPDYHVGFANRAFRDKFGESHGRRCYEYCFGKKEPCYFCEAYRVLKTGRPHHWQVTTPGGASVIDAYDFPFTDVDGSPMILEVDIDITERKRAEDLINAQRDLALALSAGPGLDEGLRLCIEAALRLSEMDGGGVYLADETSGALDLIVHQGLSADFVKAVSHYDTNSPNTQRVMAGKPIYTEHLKLEVPFKKAEIREDLHAIAVLPLHHKGRVIGCLNIASHTLHEVPLFSRVALETIAAQIGSSIARLRVEKALRESEEKYRSVVERSNDGIVIIQDGKLKYVNPILAKIVGYTVEEAIDTPFTKYIHPDELPQAVDYHKRRMAGDKQVPVRYERELLHKNGSRINTEIDGAVITYEGKLADLVIIRDISERKRMEEALRESEGKYRSLVESSEDSIYLVDKDSTYLFMNKKHLSRLGVQSNQVIGRPYGEFHSPEETKDFAQKVEKVLKTGKSLSYEYRSQRDNRYFIRTLNPVKVSKGDKPIAITVISKDITELKQTEDALREREAFNFALFHYNPVETIVVDLEGRVSGFNLAKQNSGARLPAIGDAMYKDYAGKHEIDMRAELLECIKSDKIKEFPERKYGDKYLSITISPFSNGALIISEDITSRKQAEVLLQKERDTFYSILDKAPYGVVILGKDKRDIFINTEFTNITGYDLEDVPTLKDWFRMAYPAKRYRDMVTKIWEENVVQGEADKIFRKHFHKAFFQSFKVTCKDGTVKEIEFRPTKLDNGSTVVMLADITERKRMHELLEAAATEWRATFDAINDAVCLLDVEGRIKRCNIAMMRMIGRPFNEIADCLCWEALYGVSEPPQSYPFERAQKSCHRESGVFLRDKRWFNISIDPLLNEEGKPMGFVHIMSDISKRIMVEEQLQSSREQLRDLTAYLESVREQERTRIAREIHDELAQALTALRMDLSWLNKRLPRDQMPLVEKIKSMSGLINTTIQTVKRISAELRPGILDDLGLVAAIEWQIEEFQDRTRIASHLTVYPKDITVDKDRSTAIFRIFQETLTNVARHARATRVSVAIKEKAGKLTLRVSDNGKGIKEKQISDSKSFGILGMRERVHPWGGKISIKGTSEKGTTVVVTLPLARE